MNSPYDLSRCGGPARTALTILLFCAAATGNAAAAPPAVYAVTGARIVPVSSPPVENGAIVIRDGLIEAVGAGLEIPADARIFDGRGLTVYPGLFDAYSSFGMPPAYRPRDSRPASAPPPSPAAAPASHLNAAVRASLLFEPEAAALAALRGGGITTLLTAPAQGLLQGRSALVNLSAEPGFALLKKDAAMHASTGSTGTSGYPSALMGRIAWLRQTFLDAAQQEEAWRIYSDSPRSLKRPSYNESLAALTPVLDGEMPLMMPATGDLEARRLLRLAGEFGFRLMILGGPGLDQVIPKLREIPVILTTALPPAPEDPDPDNPETVRLGERRLAAPAVAGRLHKAGVSFCFSSGGQSPAGMLKGVRAMVAAGLSSSAAIEALTLAPARIFGVDRQTGSLEAGKIANLLLVRGDLLKEESRIERVFVDGEPHLVPPAPAAERPAATGFTGRWLFTLLARQVRVELRQAAEKLTGSYESEMDRGSIEAGRVEGSIAYWTIRTIRDGVEVEIRFEAVLQGEVMKIKAATGGQITEFEARREPPAPAGEPK